MRIQIKIENHRRDIGTGLPKLMLGMGEAEAEAEEKVDDTCRRWNGSVMI